MFVIKRLGQIDSASFFIIHDTGCGNRFWRDNNVNTPQIPSPASQSPPH